MSDTGNSVPSACTTADFSAWVGQTVLLPIFDESGDTGSNAWYRVYGYAAFKLTGYHLGGQYKHQPRSRATATTAASPATSPASSSCPTPGPTARTPRSSGPPSSDSSDKGRRTVRRRLLAAFAALVLLVVGTRGPAGLRARRGRPRPGRRAAPSRCWSPTSSIPEGTSGDELADLVRTETVPAKAAVAGRVTDLAALAGRVATVDLLPGEQLLAGRFAQPRRPAGARHRRRARRACRRSASCSSRSARSAAGSPPATPSASSSR